MKEISDYAVNTYFRHYLMYKYAFTKKVKLAFTITNSITTDASVEDTSILAPPEDDLDAEHNDDPARNAGALADGGPQQNLVAEGGEAVVTSSDSDAQSAHAHDEQNLASETVAASDTHEAETTAVNTLRAFVAASLAPKLEEMKASLLQKMAAQEEMFNARLKKIEVDDGKGSGGGAAGDKAKKDVKPKGKK
ncbi:hypothetical protein HK405_009806 [Cladochytrium tenue]|nr:hypothetical protein HK405_009806 [Cladochytrium tenue]